MNEQGGPSSLRITAVGFTGGHVLIQLPEFF